MQRPWALLVFVTLALLAAWAGAQSRPGHLAPPGPSASTVTVVDGSTSLRMGKHLRILVDDRADEAREGTPHLTHAEALAADQSGQFFQSKREIPSYGFSSKVVWVKLEFEDARAVPTPLVLELSYAPLDRLELWPAEPAAAPIAVVGDALPFKERAYQYRYPTFELPAQAGKRTYFLRASGHSSLQLPLTLHVPHAFSERAISDQAAQTLYVGIMLALIIYNLFLFFGVRERGYLLYATFMALYLTYQASVSGVTYQYIWPGSPWLAERLMPICVVSAAICGQLFALIFLETKTATPRLHRGMLGLTVAYAVFLPFAAFGPTLITFRLTALVAMVFSFVVLGVAGYRLGGGRPARVFLLAWGIFLVGNILAALRVTGAAPVNIWTENAQQVGSALEGILLSIGLADRLRSLTLQAAQAQRERIAEREKAASELELLNEELRRQVAERSREIADLLHEMSFGDGEELKPGTLFDDRFSVQRRLATGGMGMVYEVERTSDGQRLALKILVGGASPQLAARFAQEAEIAASLHHPNLVRVFDFGISTHHALYLVMELVEGESLEEQRGRFGDRPWAVPVLAQAAQGLSALHQAGVVHRDLKPANVLTGAAQGPDLVVKIADFGLSRVHEPVTDGSESIPPPTTEPTLVASGAPPPMRPVASPRVLTQTGTFLGTPHYMAPEQSGGSRSVGPSADVFAFGVMAHEMLTGTAPFRAPPVYDRLAGRSIDVPPPLGQSCSDLPPELCALLDRCLREDPAVRPNMTELCDALNGAGPSSSVRGDHGSGEHRRVKGSQRPPGALKG